MAPSRRRLSLQIQPHFLTANHKDLTSDVSNLRAGMPTIPWSDPSLDQVSKSDPKYKSESSGLHSLGGPGRSFRLRAAQASFDLFRPHDAPFVWVWNNVATRDKMRRMSLAAAVATAFATVASHEPR
jgi:hypothetical protein